MREWEIHPYQGVGEIAFNMTKEQVAAIVGWPRHERQPWPGADYEWRIHDFDIEISFDPEGLCNYVGFYPGSVGVVEGIHLNGSYETMRQAFARAGHPFVEIQATRGDIPWTGEAVCDSLGVVVFREVESEPNISFAGAFRRGYLVTSDRVPRDYSVLQLAAKQDEQNLRHSQRTAPAGVLGVPS